MRTNKKKWPRQRNKRGGSCQSNQRECVRSVIEPDYQEDYMAADTHSDQLSLQPNIPQRRFSDDPSSGYYHLTEDVILDQGFVDSSLPQSRRRSCSPSYSHFLDQPCPQSSFLQPGRHSNSPFPQRGRHSGSPFPQRRRRSGSPFPHRRRRSGSPSYSKRRPAEAVGQSLSQSSYPRGRRNAQPRRRSNNPSPEHRRRFRSPLYHHLAEDVVLDQPSSQSRFGQRRRRSGSPYSKYQAAEDANLDQSSLAQHTRRSRSPSHGSSRRDSTKYKSHNEARNPRNFKGEHQYYAKRRHDSRSTRDWSPEYNHSGQSSARRKERFTSKSGFRKPIENHVKFDDQAKKSDGPSYTREAPTLASKIVASANKMEIKCSKVDGEGEVDPSAKLATKSSEDDAEVLPKTEPADEMKFFSKVDQKDVPECEKQKQKIEADEVPHRSSSCHTDLKMKDSNIKHLAKGDSRKRDLIGRSTSREDDLSCYVMLMKDNKIICRTKCTKPPIQPSSSWNVEIVKKSTIKGLDDLPHFLLFPAYEDSYQEFEWVKFLTFLHKFNRVATVVFDSLKVHVCPPDSTMSKKVDDGLFFAHALVAYQLQELCDTSVDQRQAPSVVCAAENKPSSSQPIAKSHLEGGKEIQLLHPINQTPCVNDSPAFESVTNVKKSSSAEKGTCSSISKFQEDDIAAERNFVRADPSYLKTLGQAHSGWIFGAIAELVDNSRDARASRLDIAIETIYDKTLGCEIPMLSVIDDGVGMDHQEILRMISFGHKQPDEDNLDCIGRFGVGFKTGSMRLGRDAVVLTQTTHSRSIAFLSQSLNEGKDNLEIPVVSYRRQAQCMKFDTSVQSEALAKYNLNAMKEFSPFDEYLIGEKVGQFRGNTGTQIYIWNLDKWGSDYTLEWQEGMRGGSSFHQGDIFIRSRRVRTRPGQISRKVHLDYSLQSYLEVIFLEPRMKIYVQGSLVKSRPLAKSLNKTAVFNDEIMGKQVQLTLGRCQLEWDEANCGIFLYWHGRLIEAYKRVGGMIHSADMGRGVVGVIDVTEIMDDGNGGVWVHSNKQGFQDCEAYAYLEEWLGKKADEYWDTYFDAVQLKKRNARYKPDNHWVQCNKCRKWRMLTGGYDIIGLPKDWFCYMAPFNGDCDTPEQKPGRGVITVGLKRANDEPSVAADCKGGLLIDDDSAVVEGNGQDEPTELAAEYVERPSPLKRLRRGPPRITKKQLSGS